MVPGAAASTAIQPRVNHSPKGPFADSPSLRKPPLGPAAPTSAPLAPTHVQSRRSSANSASSTATDPTSERRPRRIADLTAMAASVWRPREDRNVVRYIAQIDIADHMVKRAKMGPSTTVYVVLEGTLLSVLKNMSATSRNRVNVRETPVFVDVDRRELRICVPAPGKDKLLRLIVPSEARALEWKNALDNAVCCDIREFFHFGRTLGSGAFGDVVEAVEIKTKDQRAIKIIKKGTNIKSREHLDCEIQVMKRISHPNIVHTYQIFDLKRTIYIVMEHVPGGDLFDFVAQHECLTEQRGSDTIRSIFQAVQYLHQNSIVHRDLKPENILCANNTWPLQIKVSDFGFANFIDPNLNADDTMQTQVGTVYFMAPEILSKKGHGQPVDLWACGVILYTILTGRLPFPGKNTTEYMLNVMRGQPLFPNVLWKGISEDAKSLVKGLLNPDPNKRLTSLGALQHRWITCPDALYGTNEIRRDRSNLHSRRRRLFKARKAIIAVAMAYKFKATIPQVVDKVGDSVKKGAGAIETGVKKTADGIEKGLGEIATGVVNIGDGIAEGTKKVAGDIGEGTKKVAGGIAEGTKKVAGGIGTGVKKTVDGVENRARIVGDGMRKTADGIETGLKKTADGIETGFKKTADGIETGFKKTADGIENGFKKTADGIETGFKKTADGIETGFKKTADGIETGFKKTADGIENGFKKTAGGIETGFKKTAEGIEKGVKKTGQGVKKTTDGIGQGVKKTADGLERGVKMTGDNLKRGVERVRHDRSRETDGERSHVPSSQTDSIRRSRAARPHFRWMNMGSKSSAVSDSEQSRQSEIPVTSAAVDLDERTNGDIDDDSSADFMSALEEHSETEEGWGRPFGDIPDLGMEEGLKTGAARKPVGFVNIVTDARAISTVSNSSTGTGSRPKLAPLDGLTIGLSDESMAGSSPRGYGFVSAIRSGEGEESGRTGGFGIFKGRQEDNMLRKTAALLLASKGTGIPAADY